MIGSSPIIDGLTQLERIGSGGSAAVYKAYEEAHDRWVAIKVIHGVNDPDAARRFARETRAMGRLSEHEGIVTIHSSGLTAKDAPYLVMPYLANGSLQDQIDSDGPVAWPKAIDWMTSVARTVEWAHTRQVIHRDLKPANILLSGTNLPLVADFGIARLQEGTNSLQSQSVALTPRYSPPEVITDAATSVVSDVYGLAATLFALLQGSSPFAPSDGSDENLLAVLYRVANEPVADLRPSGVPPEICEAVEVSMSKSPDDRPQSASAFVDLLEAASEQARTRITDATVPAQVPDREISPARVSSVTVPEDTTAPRKPRSRKRRRSKRGLVVVGAAALSIVILGAGAFLISTRDEPSTVAAGDQVPQTQPSAPADVTATQELGRSLGTTSTATSSSDRIQQSSPGNQADPTPTDLTSPPLSFPSSTTLAAAILGNTGGPTSATTDPPSTTAQLTTTRPTTTQPTTTQRATTTTEQPTTTTTPTTTTLGTVSVPSVIGAQHSGAVSTLTNAGLSVPACASTCGFVVTSQNPGAGTEVATGTIAILTVAPNEISVPSVTGLTGAAAVAILKQQQLTASCGDRCQDIVTGTVPGQGSTVTPLAVVTLRY